MQNYIYYRLYTYIYIYNDAFSVFRFVSLHDLGLPIHPVTRQNYQCLCWFEFLFSLQKTLVKKQCTHNIGRAKIVKIRVSTVIAQSVWNLAHVIGRTSSFIILFMSLSNMKFLNWSWHSPLLTIFFVLLCLSVEEAVWEDYVHALQ